MLSVAWFFLQLRKVAHHHENDTTASKILKLYDDGNMHGSENGSLLFKAERVLKVLIFQTSHQACHLEILRARACEGNEVFDSTQFSFGTFCWESTS
jgi:hypothetical protein